MIQAKVRPLSNQEIMDINDEIYNRFWRKYRDSIAGNDEAWENVKTQMGQLLNKYQYHSMVLHQLQDYLDQLEWRYMEGRKQNG